MPSYPDISDYTDSVQNAAGQVIDPILHNAQPRLKGGRPEMMSGGVAVVYPFQDGPNIYAVKCWLRDIGDSRDHYRRVHSFLSSCKSAYFVDFAYVEKGIIAKDQIWPFLRMKWVGGKNLLEFVNINVSDGPALVLLAKRYLAMSQHLHKLGVAHGDLQGSNIKVVGSGTAIDFQLIDYDTLVVPSSHGRKADATALPSYQHPKRGSSRYYNGKEDYFSELVIYLSLLAVAEKPSMWSKYPKGDPGLKDEDRHDKDMLFVKEDFLSDRPTEVFKELFRLSPVVKNLTLILWNFTRRQNIDQLQPLEEMVVIAHDLVSHSSKLSKHSGFAALLNASIDTVWLDDTDFVQRPLQPMAAVSKNTAPISTQSFENLLNLNGNATINESRPRSDRLTTMPPNLSRVAQKILAVLACFVLIIIVVLVWADTKSRNSTTQLAISPASEEQDKIKRRLVWKIDLQRRKEESDATYADLAKRRNDGLLGSEVDSFNAEVVTAERVRTELEAEINDYNNKLEVPPRYQ